MLQRSFNTATSFAEDLAKKGYRLAANPATVLSDLLSSSSPLEQEKVINSPLSNEDTISNFGFNLDFHSRGEAGLKWGLSFDQYVSELSKALGSQISYIRNTVVPRVVEFTSESLKFIEDLGKNNPAADLEIYRAKIPEVVTDPAFLSTLEQYKFKTVIKPNNSTLNLPFTSVPEDLLSVASLGNARLDGLVTEWNVSEATKYIETVWYSFFAGKEVLKDYHGAFVDQEDLASPDLYIRLNVSLAYFLIANYYSGHLPDIVTQEPTSSLERRLYDHLSYAGAVLADTLRRITANNQANILVTFIDTFHKKITVSEEVYEKWLATGGNPDIILGILVGTKRYYSVGEIDKNAKDLQQTWNNYTRVYLEDVEHKKAYALRTFYLQLLTKYLTSDYQEELEVSFYSTSPTYKDKILEDSRVYLHGLKKEDLLNVHKVAKELIAGEKYGFTYAKQFISDMDEVGLHSENAVPEEAALVATINYLVDYLRGQIAVVRV